MESAGIRHVRSAPSSCVKRSIDVESWVEKELVSKKKVDEKSEVDKIKVEIQEIKKVMMEQAELIKALTSKQ